MKELTLLLAIVLFAGGCSRQEMTVAPHGPISFERSIEIAKTAATAQGYKIEEYELERVRLDISDDGKHPFWSLFFEGRDHAIGNHFVIHVGKQNGDIKIFPGM
jgi:hypothetical protein